jgi:hypothetical protein
MLRPVVGAMVVTALAGATTIALAEDSSNSGTHHILRVSASPPVAGTASDPQPVALKFDSLEYTDSGQRSKLYTRTLAYRFNGFRFHHGAFPTCLESKLEKSGAGACPTGSKIGTGKAVADARPALAGRIKAKVVAFNGMLDVDSDGKPITPVPAVLIAAKSSTGLKAYVPVLFKGGDKLVTAPRPAPQGDNPPPYTIVRLSVKFPVKTTTKDGEKVPYIEAPRGCPNGQWKFSQVDNTYSGQKLRATDSQPCAGHR